MGEASRLYGNWMVRVDPRETFEIRKFAPLPRDHPALHDQRCAACARLFVIGDRTTLIPLGPGDHLDEMAKAAAKRPYNAVAAMLHWSCATGEGTLG